MSKKMTIQNEEQLISSLKTIVSLIQTQENPEELGEYKKIFKKAVPFMFRNYFAAYIIKQFNCSKHDSVISNFNFKQSIIKPARQKVLLPENQSVSLFVGVGRNKGVFPKDIITLFIQSAGIQRENIGNIRILDNYSFVQVLQNDADSIIEKLNHIHYRGKALNVSYSKKTSDDVEACEVLQKNNGIENEE